MEMLLKLSLLFIFYLNCLPLLIQGSIQYERKPYIIYMGELPESRTYVPEDHHHDLLATVIGDHQLARESRIHSYGKSFNGFAARLFPHEAEKLLEEESVVSVFPNRQNKLHTTRSWDFLGMPLKVKRQPTIESNIIVGVLDTGIDMDCPSFNDSGYGPPPPAWKGKCIKGTNFTGCNNKVIGAKFFNLLGATEGSNSPADDEGHGTHTASTAAGAAVKGASLHGVGRGTARGGVPSARLAIYKVCWNFMGCNDLDLLAGFDEAIDDGVNLVSLSSGGTPRDFFSDPIAIGSFHAMKRGILTSCAAGNDGPSTMTVENVAPWIVTVAATTTDREFTTVVTLGDGKKLEGMAINTFAPKKNMYPLISGSSAADIEYGIGNASACDSGTLIEEKVKGRIVYCLGSGSKDYIIQELGGVGIIVAAPDPNDYSYTTMIPGVYLDAKTAAKTIDLYINSTNDLCLGSFKPINLKRTWAEFKFRNTQAVIQKTTSTTVPAPFVASFSSRGPQTIAYNILKPDLAAPGVDILAGFSKLPTITGYPQDKRHSVFNILSGTSMACPHVTAAAAYVKSFHPHWSPAAIKSALMTTATPIKIRGDLEELGSGSGQINPVRALDPGLIYDISMNCYVAFLCKQGYNSTNIGILIGKKGFNCSRAQSPRGIDGINYPSMHIQVVPANSSISATFHRKVTNVGFRNSTYKARVIAPKGLSIKVIPDTLKFRELKQELFFKVVLKGPRMPNDTKLLAASLEWNDSIHSVRSPIVVYKPTL